MNHIGLFEGIGGFSLAARWAGWETIAWCEINPFGQKVLKHHFPKATGHDDIKSTDFTIYRGKCDILTGGFPCQPYSAAGKRLGTEDDRHLWPEMLRAIREIQPSYVVGENVRGLTNWNGGLVFDQVQADLEAEGYEVLPFLLPACAVNAPHRRDRIWFVAYSKNKGRCESGSYNSGWNTNELKSYNRDQIRDPVGSVIETGSPSNPNLGTTGTPGESGGPESNRSNNNDVPEQRGGETEFNTGPHEFLRTTSDTDNSGAGINLRPDRIGSEKNEGREGFSQPEFGAVGGNVTNANSGRQPSEEYRKAEPGWTAKESLRDYWKNFPTQPPICSGNDGISGELDGITFPKWRNESIKAYGNAIVPQVAYEIFKSILNSHSPPSQTQT
jgi:DNA (cytosine-5)-methyltransferase 1